MRKVVALAILSSFLFVNLAPALAVTPKAGATCKKLGAKETFKGREFTCIKKGSKRVWNRGVVVRTPAQPTVSPTPTPTPVVTPTPTPTPTPTSVVTPTPTPVVTPTPTPAATPTPTPTPVVTPTPTPTPSPTPAATTSSSGTTTREYTRAEVEARNTPSDCWSIINGNVYNLTSWISQHPGGRFEIEVICGQDGTRRFNTMHQGSSGPQRQLESFLIGRLK